MAYEVELKFRVSNPDQFRVRLEAVGGRPQATKNQVDHYFNHPSRDFARTDEALRIRSAGEDNFVTYKGPKIDATTKTRREIEVPIGGGEASRLAFAELLRALGFRDVRAVRKRREIYHLTAGKDRIPVEAALDSVESLGWFVELEATAEEADVSRVRAALVELAADLELTEGERRAYLELLLESDGPP